MRKRSNKRFPAFREPQVVELRQHCSCEWTFEGKPNAVSVSRGDVMLHVTAASVLSCTRWRALRNRSEFGWYRGAIRPRYLLSDIWAFIFTLLRRLCRMRSEPALVNRWRRTCILPNDSFHFFDLLLERGCLS